MTLAEAASVRCQTWRLEVSVFLASAVAAHTACRIRPMSWGRHRHLFDVPPSWCAWRIRLMSWGRHYHLFHVPPSWCVDAPGATRTLSGNQTIPHGQHRSEKSTRKHMRLNLPWNSFTLSVSCRSTSNAASGESAMKLMSCRSPSKLWAAR